MKDYLSILKGRNPVSSCLVGRMRDYRDTLSLVGMQGGRVRNYRNPVFSCLVGSMRNISIT